MWVDSSDLQGAQRAWIWQQEAGAVASEVFTCRGCQGWPAAESAGDTKQTETAGNEVSDVTGAYRSEKAVEITWTI